jgi:hypothetical protein
VVALLAKSLPRSREGKRKRPRPHGKQSIWRNKIMPSAVAYLWQEGNHAGIRQFLRGSQGKHLFLSVFIIAITVF